MPGIFGTDGVRGVANTVLTPEQALRIGRVGAARLAADQPEPSPANSLERPLIVLGRDTRLSGDLLTAAVTAGCCSVGVDVVDVGVLPTPGVAFLTRRLRAAGGVVISASHNPVDDNGIKFFDHAGYKLSPETEALIEEKVRDQHDRLPRPVGSGVGRRNDGRTHCRHYADHLMAGLTGVLKGVRVVIDAGFGATALLAPEVLERAGAEVIALNASCDGSRINVDCGSTSPGRMAEVVVAREAAAGLAFDGDGDRVILADEKGQIVDGDQIMAILALDLIERKLLPKKAIVATVMSNGGLDLAIRAAGGRVIRTPVGDRSVLQAMLKGGLVLGGEQSGHVILLRHGTTGDGVLAGLAVLSVMVGRGLPLSELAGQVVPLPQVLINVIVNQKDKLQTSEKIATAIERTREALGHTGRVLVRPSGTEPLVRVMLEGHEAELINRMAMELAGVVVAELGGEIAGKHQ